MMIAKRVASVRRLSAQTKLIPQVLFSPSIQREIAQQQQKHKHSVLDQQQHWQSTTTTTTTTTTASIPSIVLYQYAICPFCHRVKALLSFGKIPHHIVEVNPLTKAELKPWSGDYKKVPIAKIDNEQINGSDAIIHALLDHPSLSSSSTTTNLFNPDFRTSSSAIQWSQFATNELASLIYPNICRTLSDSYQAFDYVNDVSNFSWIQKKSIQSIGSIAMYFAASRVKAKRGIKDERKALLDALQQWEEEGLEHGTKEYASGLDMPNLGDIYMFGTLKSVEGLMVHNEIIHNRNGPTREWYHRMLGHMMESS